MRQMKRYVSAFSQWWSLKALALDEDHKHFSRTNVTSLTVILWCFNKGAMEISSGWKVSHMKQMAAMVLHSLEPSVKTQAKHRGKTRNNSSISNVTLHGSKSWIFPLRHLLSRLWKCFNSPNEWRFSGRLWNRKTYSSIKVFSIKWIVAVACKVLAAAVLSSCNTSICRFKPSMYF